MADETSTAAAAAAPAASTVEVNKAGQGEKANGQGTSTSQTVHIRVASPFNVYFDEEALSISAENDTGPFDILPRHHNFITLLNACEIVVRTTKGDFRIQISGGVMHVKADQIVVFLNV